MHEYTEATLIHKPEIAISLQEICDTHCLLLEYQDQIADDPMDSLHELLDDLGNAPSVATLLGLSKRFTYIFRILSYYKILILNWILNNF